MPDAPAIAQIILAGGRGVRMGGVDKAQVRLGGQPLIAHVARRLGRVDAISANGEPARFAAFGVPVLADAEPEQGPLGGVLAALRWAGARGFSAIVSAAVDTPFFPADLPAQLVRHHRATGAPVVIAAGTGPDGVARWQPTFGLWACAVAPRLDAALRGGERRMEAVARALGAAALPVAGAGAFANINTLHDLAQAEERLAQDGQGGGPASP